jgi:hypothetical protein
MAEVTWICGISLRRETAAAGTDWLLWCSSPHLSSTTSCLSAAWKPWRPCSMSAGPRSRRMFRTSNGSGPGPLDHLWSLAVEERSTCGAAGAAPVSRQRGRLDRMARHPDGRQSFLLMLLLAARFDIRCLRGNRRAWRSADRGCLGHGVAAYTAASDTANRRRRGPRRAALAIIVAMFVLTNEYSMWHWAGFAAVTATAVLGAVVHPARWLDPSWESFRCAGSVSAVRHLSVAPAVVAFMPQTVLYPSACSGRCSARLIICCRR